MYRRTSAHPHIAALTLIARVGVLAAVTRARRTSTGARRNVGIVWRKMGMVCWLDGRADGSLIEAPAWGKLAIQAGSEAQLALGRHDGAALRQPARLLRL